MAQAKSGIFVGGEARYLRQYDGFGCICSPDRAFYWTDDLFQAFRTSMDRSRVQRQVAGQATTVAGSLDLVNFERRQARLQFGVSF